MNKKQNPADVLSKRTTVRYTHAEYKIVKLKAKNAGLSFSNFCRQMTIEGYVQAALTPHDLNEIRLFKALLLEYRTNFSRISNIIKNSDPALHLEIDGLKNSIKNVIDMIQL